MSDGWGPNFGDDEPYDDGWGPNWEAVKEIEREKQRQKAKPPSQYNVLFLNDDFTTFEFVIDVLARYYGQTAEQAARSALDLHTKGKCLAGTFPKDIAETKAQQTRQMAQAEEYPLMPVVEEAQ